MICVLFEGRCVLFCTSLYVNLRTWFVLCACLFCLCADGCVLVFVFGLFCVCICSVVVGAVVVVFVFF